MPRKPIIEHENIFIVKTDELKVMMRKYHDAFPEALKYYFDNSVGTKTVDFAETRNKINCYFARTKIDFNLNDYFVNDRAIGNSKFQLPYELSDIYCVMAYAICNKNNLLSDGKRIVSRGTSLEDISNFHKYNEEALRGIDILPAQISSFIRRQPGYKEHTMLTKYLYEISDRFAVLLSAAAHSEDGMGLLIDKLDDFISDFIHYENKRAPVGEPSTHVGKPKAPIYFDRLFVDAFLDILQHPLQKNDGGNIFEKDANIFEKGIYEIYEECLLAAWSRYNAQLDQKSVRYSEIYSEAELNEPIFGTLGTRKTLFERRLRYDPYEFLELILVELKENGVTSKGYYIAQGDKDRRLKMPLRANIEALLNSAYNNIDKYRHLYRDEYIRQSDKDEIDEYIRIFDDLIAKNNTPAKMRQKENYKYKKFFREIYLASLGFGGKNVRSNESFTKEQPFEARWILPYCYKMLISGEDVWESIEQELENDYDSKKFNQEHLELAVEIANRTLNGYKGLTKFVLFLFVLFDFMTRIRKGETNSSQFLPMIESSVEEKVNAIGLSSDERTGLYDYSTMMTYFERKLDWKNILNDENYLLFYELKENSIRSGPFKSYYRDLKEGAGRIIEIITDSDGNKFAYDFGLLSADIEPEATMFIEKIFVERELAKARKYYEHKNRSKFVENNVRSIMGGLFRDIAMKEMNLKR